jgi:hypothetical protein
MSKGICAGKRFPFLRFLSILLLGKRKAKINNNTELKKKISHFPFGEKMGAVLPNSCHLKPGFSKLLIYGNSHDLG